MPSGRGSPGVMPGPAYSPPTTAPAVSELDVSRLRVDDPRVGALSVLELG